MVGEELVQLPSGSVVCSSISSLKGREGFSAHKLGMINRSDGQDRSLRDFGVLTDSDVGYLMLLDEEGSRHGGYGEVIAETETAGASGGEEARKP